MGNTLKLVPGPAPTRCLPRLEHGRPPLQHPKINLSRKLRLVQGTAHSGAEKVIQAVQPLPSRRRKWSMGSIPLEAAASRDAGGCFEELVRGRSAQPVQAGPAADRAEPG